MAGYQSLGIECIAMILTILCISPAKITKDFLPLTLTLCSVHPKKLIYRPQLFWVVAEDDSAEFYQPQVWVHLTQIIRSCIRMAKEVQYQDVDLEHEALQRT